MKVVIHSDWLQLGGLFPHFLASASDRSLVFKLKLNLIPKPITMADRLTQLQDAADQVCSHSIAPNVLLTPAQLVTQMVASLFYINRHHDLQTLGPKDVVRQDKKVEGEPEREKEGLNSFAVIPVILLTMLQWNLIPQMSSKPAKKNSRKTSSLKNNKLNT